MVAGTALVVVWTAMYMTGYTDYLTIFREPHSPPYRRHTGLKEMSSAITVTEAANTHS